MRSRILTVAGPMLAIVGLFGAAAFDGAASAADGAPAPAEAALAQAKRQLALPPGTTAMELRMRGSTYRPEQAREATAAFAEVAAEQTVVLADEGRFRLRTRSRYPGGIVFGFLGVGSPAGSATIDELQWRDGVEIEREDAASARGDYADLLFLSPALLLRDALARNPVARAASGPDAARRIELRYQDAVDHPVVLVLDADSGRIESATSGKRRYVYARYRQQGQLLQPAHVTVYNGEAVAARWNEVSAHALPAPAADAFRLPEGYRERADRGPLRATDLGNGAYRIDGAPSGYHTGFVAGERAVAVFDASIDAEEAGQVKAMIEKTVPGRRIAYVVVSHPHGDHVAGLPAYLKDGVEVVTGVGAGAALRRQLGAAAPRKLREVKDVAELDLGGRTLQVRALASSHASSMLVAYAPASRTLFQGDLFYLPEVGPTPAAFEGAGELAALIAGPPALPVDRIVGVHGRSGDIGDLRQSIRLRQEGEKPGK
ncbi:MBL fold metallo-hydrolase [Luteimonas aquatica]|uniref:MBL fold metallo-hydrolase n=1 Tax=Luteimonas aquatica TaxID=450364 RepID=UPI001F5A7875|nr:MBL fold metallo-hydrolase [Luteimonas aquatica]